MILSVPKTFLLLSLSLLFSVTEVFCQGDVLSFSDSREINGVSDSELFQRSKKSLNTSFLESNLQLLEVEENGNGGITGSSIVDFATKDAQLRTVASGSLSFTFEVSIMSGEVELTLTNWVHHPSKSKYNFGQLTTDPECPNKVSGTMKKSRNNVWTDLKTTAKETSETLLENFINSLGEKADGQTELMSQTKTIGLPSDIKSVGVIFLKHQLAEIEETSNPSNSEKLKNKNKEQHNVMAPKANDKLENVLAEYPYKYVVANDRSQLGELYEEGYKYVLDCVAYDNMKNGNFKSSAKVEYFYELYIKDLSANTIYIITDKLSERSVYDFKLMINKYLKKAIEDTEK
jgi:hypothetical protein